MLFVCYPKCTTCQKARKWLVGYTDFINRMENPGTNKQSIAALIADGDELEKRIKRVHTGEISVVKTCIDATQNAGLMENPEIS